MGTWKRKLISKEHKGRQESGRAKGIVASPLVKYMCRANRSYKHPLYDVVMTKLNGEKQRKGK